MKTPKTRVVVALSGGVDSAAAAVLLKKQGHDVVGMTMCFNLTDSPSTKFTLSKAEGLRASRGRPSCCGLQGIEDARRVAQALGIKHYVVNMQKALSERIIDDFCSEYARGRTPNPCVRCNQFLKFGALLTKARAIDADYLATGHYARVVKGRRSKGEAGRYALKKGRDARKDQSYFLYRLGQEQLGRVLFPLGGYTKTEVREIARKAGLAVADKQGSQEICFIAGKDYREFIRERLSTSQQKPGPVVDTRGAVLGEHKGIALYTVGQRQGLGIAYRHPLYVVALDAARNTITVGSYDEACSSAFTLSQPHWIHPPVKKKIVARVKIRYNHTEQPAEIIPQNKTYIVRFAKPQFAVTPGQSAVVYSGQTVLGGGIIDKVLEDKEFNVREK